MLWPDGQHSRYVFYDANGRVQSTVDERATVVQYLYDAADRVTDIQWPATPAQNVHITYDAADRPLIVSDGVGQREYSYDPTLHRVSRVRTTLKALPAGHNIFDVSYSYNPDGSVATMTSPAGVTGYSYDAAGQLVSLIDPVGNSTICPECVWAAPCIRIRTRSPARPSARPILTVVPPARRRLDRSAFSERYFADGQRSDHVCLFSKHDYLGNSWPCKASAQIPASAQRDVRLRPARQADFGAGDICAR